MKRNLELDKNNKSPHHQHLKKCQKIYSQLHHNNLKMLIIKKQHIPTSNKKNQSQEVIIHHRESKQKAKKRISMPKILKSQSKVERSCDKIKQEDKLCKTKQDQLQQKYVLKCTKLIIPDQKRSLKSTNQGVHSKLDLLFHIAQIILNLQIILHIYLQSTTANSQVNIQILPHKYKYNQLPTLIINSKYNLNLNHIQIQFVRRLITTLYQLTSIESVTWIELKPGNNQTIKTLQLSCRYSIKQSNQNIKMLNIHPILTNSPSPSINNNQKSSSKQQTNKTNLHKLHTQISERILRYCKHFFNNYQKVKMQIILREHYFKLFLFRLKPIFILQRIALYSLHQLIINQGLTNQSYQMKMLVIIGNLRDVYEIILKVISETNKATHMINQAFKILKSVSEVEKKINSIQRQLTNIYNQAKQSENITQIFRRLRPYLQDQSCMNTSLQRNPFQIPTKNTILTSTLTYQSLVKTDMLLSWKYLHVPPTPFLPPLSLNKNTDNFQYTLVIDLHQTIVHFDYSTHVLKYRPGMDMFFRECKNIGFEIILFVNDKYYGTDGYNNNQEGQMPQQKLKGTLQQKIEKELLKFNQNYGQMKIVESSHNNKYTQLIIKQVQSKCKIFDYRLYGQHLTLCNGRYVKDIRRLGRDLRKTIIIDDMSTNFGQCINNGIQVSSWYGDKNDRQLTEILKIISQLKPQKLQQLKKYYNQSPNCYYQETQQSIEQQSQKNKEDIRVLLKNNNTKLKRMLQKQQERRLGGIKYNQSLEITKQKKNEP